MLTQRLPDPPLPFSKPTVALQLGERQRDLKGPGIARTVLYTYFGEENPSVARGEPKTLNFYLSKPHTQNRSQTPRKESNDIVDGDAKPLAFIQGAEEIVGWLVSF